MTVTLASAARVLVQAMDGNYPLWDALAVLRRASEANDQRDGFAATCWSVDDILGRLPAWTDHQAHEWLAGHASLIQSAMVDAGAEAIDVLLDD